MKNVINSTESQMFHAPMCVMCAEKEVQIVVNATGAGYCSAECEAWANEQDEAKEHFDSLLAKQYEDEPFGPMAEQYAEYDEERKLDGDMDEPFDRDLRDDEAALESVYGPEDDGGYDDFNDWG